MKKIALCLITLLLALTLAAWGGTEQAAPEADSVTVTDMVGRTVTIDGPVERMLVNSPETMEVVLSVIGESGVDKIVAVGSNKSSEIVMNLYAEKYPQLADLPSIGGGKNSPYDPERIIALEPDVFILNSWDADSMTETINTLAKAGIATIIVDMSANAMEAPQQAIEILGQVFREEEKAREIIDFINTQLDLVREKNLGLRTDKPTVYIEKGSGTVEQYDVTFATGQWASVVEIAGGDNVAAGALEGDVQIDPEYLLSQDPDFIIIAGSLGFGSDIDEADGLFEQYASRTGWDRLSAVQNKRMYEVSHTMSRNAMCFYPTLQMAKLFYPEEFRDVDPDAILKEFFDKYIYLDHDLGIWFNTYDKDR